MIEVADGSIRGFDFLAPPMEEGWGEGVPVLKVSLGQQTLIGEVERQGKTFDPARRPGD